MKIYITSFLLFLVIHKYQIKGTIHYASHCRDRVLSREMKELSQEVIVNELRSDSIRLSAKERRYLLRQLKKPENIELPDNLFPDSKRVEPDSLEEFVVRQNQRIRDSLMASGNPKARDEYYSGKTLYLPFYFTRPIYLRNRSIILFHFMWRFRNGGSHDLSFYRKENGKWKRWISISGGDW
jgi:hypothetical protein